MGLRAAVQPQPVPIKAPGQTRVGLKIVGRGNLRKAQPRLPKCGIGFPEALIAAKIRQAAIHPHARACGNDDAIGSGYQFRSLRNGGLLVLS